MSIDNHSTASSAPAFDLQDRPTPTDRMWDEKEVARFLGLSVEFLQQDRAKNIRIPFLRIGRAVRYDPIDVVAFKESCKVTAHVARRQDDEIDLDCFTQRGQASAGPGLYALLHNGVIQYIGMSSNIAQRITAHMFGWDECWYFRCNESRARPIEARLIEKHQPKYNVRSK